MGAGIRRGARGSERAGAGRQGLRALVPGSCCGLLLAAWAALAGCGEGIVLPEVPATAP